MGTYKINESKYREEHFCPSTSPVSFMNKGGLDNWAFVWSIGGMLPFFISLALIVEVSLFFLLVPVVWVAGGFMILLFGFSRYKMQGSDYSRLVLPVERAYARLVPSRKKKYKHLVKQAYQNAITGKSNNQIIELLETYAKLDDKLKKQASTFVKDELEIARKVAADMLEMERRLEST